MKTVCAWCGLILKDGPPAPVSEGICHPCAMKELGHLDLLPVPKPETSNPRPQHDRSHRVDVH